MENSSFEARWRRRFDEFAETQETDASIAGWSETGLETRVRAFIRYWKPRPVGERWLDLGCGAGTYTRQLADEGLNVVGADYSPRTLVKARSRSAKSISWLSADAKQLPFADATFDGILCFGVTQVLSETLPVAAEAARVLRPGGELWIDALNAACLANAVSVVARRLSGLSARLRYDRVDSIRRSLRKAGFGTVGVYWLPLAPSGWRGLQRVFESRASEVLFHAAPSIASCLSHSFMVHARR